MKRIIAVSLPVLALVLAWGTPVMAAPNENAPCVAACAVTMGGQHVAECAKTMVKGVSECAQMNGPCPTAR